MFSAPIRGVLRDLVDVLVEARQADGAHAYYSNGWAFGREAGKLILPSFILGDIKFIVVFTVSKQTSKHGVLFGKWLNEEKTHFALDVDEHFDAVVQKNGIAANGDEVLFDDYDKPLEGFHVLRFHSTFGDLQVDLDRDPLLGKNAFGSDANDFNVFKAKTPGTDNTFVIWEAHQVVPDINAQFVPERAMKHHGIYIGIGGYVLMRGDWKNKPVVYLDGKDVSTPLNVELERGEQIIAVKVYKDNFTISTSAIPSKCWVHYGGVPITQVVHWKKEHVNAFYDYTVVFTGTRHK